MRRMRRRDFSLFIRLFVAFLCVAIPTCGLAMVTVYLFSRQTVERHVKESLVQQVATLGHSFLHEHSVNATRALRTLAASSLLDEYLAASEMEKSLVSKKIERLFLQTTADFRTVRSIAFVAYTGAEHIAVSGPRRVKQYRHLLRPDNTAPPAFWAAAAPLFQQLAASPPGTIQVAGPFADATGELVYLTGITKLDLNTGRFAGIVLMRQSLAAFFAELGQVALFGEHPLWVLAPDGGVLQQPHQERAHLDPRGALPQEVQEVPALLTVPTGIMVYQDLAIVPGQPLMRLVVSIPTALFAQEFRPMLRFFSLVFGLAGLVAFLTALSVSRYLSRPMVALAAAVRHLAQGNLATRVQVRTGGEVQRLVDSFNQMAEDLQQTTVSRNALMQEIAERQRVQEELRIAKDAAEAANQAKSSFLANMSHELRTPLNAIIGYSEMLQEEAEAQGQEDCIGDLQKIRLAGRQLLALISDILDLPKIDAGKMTLSLETFDVSDLVHEVVAVAQPLAAKNANTLEVQVADNTGMMYADLVKVRQSLFNLLSNACKFTEKGSIRLHVCRTLHDDGEWLTFAVSDTGIGLSPEQSARLFQSFMQADVSTTRKYGGTGLGLAISRHFCQMMGGDISVASELGLGCVFTIRLPAEVAEVTAAA